MAIWTFLIPALPLLAAFTIGGLHFAGWINGEAGEKTSSRIAITAISLALLISLAGLATGTAEVYDYGTWLHVSKIIIGFKLVTGGFNLALASLFALLLLVVMRFSVNYMHREAGFHRWFFTLS
jgi:NADH:ubiquinone oxidoreductase subunit 5 (subunit L)/multisubunit Na+/H+ antiporter MnhA subunit